jgi:hypothetical protein
MPTFAWIFGAATFVAALSVLRTKLVFELSATSLLLFGTTRPGLALYSTIMFPGTVIHELSHWIVAELLRVRTGEITIFPTTKDKLNGQQSLGSVATSKTDPFRSFAIGIAPFATGLAVLFFLTKLILEQPAIWQLILLYYGIVVTGNSMLTSDSDRKNWPIALLGFAAITALLYYLGMRIPENIFLLLTQLVEALTKALLLTMLLNLATIGLLLLLRKIIEQYSKRRIICDY